MKVQLVTPYRVSHCQSYGVRVRVTLLVCAHLNSLYVSRHTEIMYSYAQSLLSLISERKDGKKNTGFTISFSLAQQPNYGLAAPPPSVKVSVPII